MGLPGMNDEEPLTAVQKMLPSCHDFPQHNLIFLLPMTNSTVSHSEHVKWRKMENPLSFFFFTVIVVCFCSVLFCCLVVSGHAAQLVGILVPQPGIKPMPPAVEARSPNRWTVREVPENPLIRILIL